MTKPQQVKCTKNGNTIIFEAPPGKDVEKYAEIRLKNSNFKMWKMKVIN